MNVMFVTAEYAPLVAVGGLAEASRGLVESLRSLGVEVEVVLPDYFGTPLLDEQEVTVAGPRWAGNATVRSGVTSDGVAVSLVDVANIRRNHPYVDEAGDAWPDNPDRFFAFSAAVAAYCKVKSPDVLHLNDWHPAAMLGFMDAPPPTVLTVHNLAYQGWTSGGWLERIPNHMEAFAQHGGTNPLAGALALASKVVAVSPSYAQEIATPEFGAGLDWLVRERGDDVVGIVNGIDTTLWDPATDGSIAENYSVDSTDSKRANTRDLITQFGWPDDGRPVVGMITRLVDQKGVDIALDVVRFFEHLPARLVLVGSGDKWLAERAAEIARSMPNSLSFHNGYDVDLAHRVFAGADLLLMPSRFEPCGLSQMQAMRYGTIPVVTAVGGLRDTVMDIDTHPEHGTGTVSGSVDSAGVIDALYRADRAWRSPRTRAAMQERGMSQDWSWASSAAKTLEVYQQVM